MTLRYINSWLTLTLSYHYGTPLGPMLVCRDTLTLPELWVITTSDKTTEQQTNRRLSWDWLSSNHVSLPSLVIETTTTRCSLGLSVFASCTQLSPRKPWAVFSQAICPSQLLTKSWQQHWKQVVRKLWQHMHSNTQILSIWFCLTSVVGSQWTLGAALHSSDEPVELLHCDYVTMSAAPQTSSEYYYYYYYYPTWHVWYIQLSA